jgi:hypothetical protein
MEDVLEVDQRPPDDSRPRVGLDEFANQLLSRTRLPVPATGRHPVRLIVPHRATQVFQLFLDTMAREAPASPGTERCWTARKPSAPSVKPTPRSRSSFWQWV